MQLNETHDPSLKSWVKSAQAENTDFTIQNLPYAIFKTKNSQEQWRAGVAIGDQILDIQAVVQKGIFSQETSLIANTLLQDNLNEFMALGQKSWSLFRRELSCLLATGSTKQDQLAECLVPMRNAEYKTPARISDYTDFFTSIYHATNAGRFSRPDNPLTPNYPWVPIAYHGRASSIDLASEIIRPNGQFKVNTNNIPVFGPTRKLDFELEMGIYVGVGNHKGQAIHIDNAESHLFGMCLLNDWSARDVQRWEAQPLGPFLAKNFATSLSPWIVTMEALLPYRTVLHREEGYESILLYLDSEATRKAGALDIHLQAFIQTDNMQKAGSPPEKITSTNYKYAFWTPAQMVAHHTINGCNLATGDLLGTGTLSGPNSSEAGAMLELTADGSQPLLLSNGENRSYLEDNDTIILTGWCAKPGFARIGFGACTGKIVSGH